MAAAAHSAVLSPTMSSSTRSSLDQSAAPADATPTQSRRNKSALRDYYNLRGAGAVANSSTSTVNTQTAAPSSETTAAPKSPSLLAPLDATPFDAQAYMDEQLQSATLTELMRTQAALSSETRGLDGERKGLVYDNYGRLIGARDVVQQIGLFLGPEETSDYPQPGDSSDQEKGVGSRSMGQLKQGVEKLRPMVEGLTSRTAAASEVSEASQQQRDVVRWALASPARIRQLVTDGEQEQAETLWGKVEALLKQWQGVEGVEQLRRRGETALRGGEKE